MRIKPLLLSLLALLPGCSSVDKYPQPAYTVVQPLGENMEIRDYPPLLLAEMAVPVEARRDAASKAFMPLFRYISDADIPMTTPVIQEKAASGWRLQFIMPHDASLASIPAPTNDAMTLKELPARRVAALRFSGRTTDANVAEQEKRLRSAAESAGLTITGDAVYAYYDDPFTLPMFRRNEVLIPVSR